MKKPKIIFVVLLVFGVLPTFGQDTLSANLKAILIVGINLGGIATDTVKMNKIAELFSENGVMVCKFYGDNSKWDEIVKESKDCNFFVYSGHGSTSGKDGNAGGLSITPRVSTATLISELKLQDNSLILFKSVCNGAGSSAGDDRDIGITEAKKRVYNYAYPFFEIGASAYYADNQVEGVYNFLKTFLSGIALKQGFLDSTKRWELANQKVEFEAPFPGDPDKFYSISSRPGGGTGTRTTHSLTGKKVEKIIMPKSYEIAYAGYADFSINDMK